MDVNNAIRKRIGEILEERNISLTSLCLQSNLTPSTIFDFTNCRSKSPTIITIKKLCVGAGITLQEFFDKDYFNSDEDVYN